MAVIKIRIGGQWVTVGGSGLVSEANSYTDEQIKAVNASIAQLDKDLGDTNDYVDNAFRDGVITETEAKRIATYLNTLTTSKNNLDERTAQLLGNANLPSSRGSSLTAAKSNFDAKYQTLVDSINTAILDGKATTDETADVDARFADFNASVSLLTDQLEQASMDITQDKIDSLQQFSSSYTDAMKATLSMAITQANSNTSAAKAYIDPIFQAGIVYDSQREQINAWMTTIDNDKKALDVQYKSLDSNTDLTDTNPKNNLESSYSSLDSAYQDFVTTMNEILTGSQVTAAQTSDFETKLSAYTNFLALFSASGEEAIDSIATVKGNRANANAVAYAKPLKDNTDSLGTDIKSKTDALYTEIDKDFKDGMVIVNEKTAIQTALSNLANSKANFDSNYNDIYNDSTLSPIPKGQMSLNKTTYEDAYQKLVTSVNNAIADNYATGNEQPTIENNVTLFKQSVTDLNTQVNSSIDYIAQKKADAAEFAGYTYSDTKLMAVDGQVSDMQQTIQAQGQDITDAKNNIVYKVEVNSSNGLVFKNGNLNTILSATVMYGQDDVSSTTDASKYTWTRFTGDTTADSAWNAAHGQGVKTLVLTSADVGTRATFTCAISN